MPPPPVASRPGVVTRAKNATQRPGLIDRESQPIRRGPAEMAKVRSIARLDTRHTDQRLYAALKKVAEIQDQQQADDFEANIQKLAPSLRRWEKKSYQVPDDNDALHEAIPVETEVETQEVDPMDEGLSIDEEDAPPMQRQRLAEPDFDDYSNFKSGDEEGVLRKRPVPYYNYFNFGSDDEDLAPIAARKEPPKKKKKGDGLRDVVATLRKNPPGENSSKVKMRVTQVAPPIPAPKGKVKARPLSSATRAPSVAYPTTKSTVGLNSNWADQVADTTRSTPYLSHGSSRSRVGLDRNPLASGSRGGPSTEYQLGALEHDIEDDILSCLAPEHKASIAQPHVTPKRKFGADSTLSPVPTSNKKLRRKIAPLPSGAEVGNMFRGTFIPTYERWVGTQANPWVIPDDVAIKTLQAIWDVVYLAVPWTVKANDCVFERVVQRLCEWRSSFRSAADVMFELFFDNDVMFKDYSACQKWAGKILKDCDFVWAVPEKGNQSGLMRAPFILQVFAMHLNSIVGAQEVPEIEVAGDFEDASVVSRYPPIGALALATAAVERTLRLWANGEIGPGIKAVAKLNPQTGVVSNATSHFSTENWGQETMYYVKSISKMKTVTLEEIVDLAAPFMSPLKSRQLSARALADNDNDNDNDNLRACLVEVEDWHMPHKLMRSRVAVFFM